MFPVSRSRGPAGAERAAAPAPTYCFAVQAAADPGVMSRVLELFAKRGLVPSRWHSTVAGAAGEELHIDVQMTALAPDLGDTIARGLRQIVHVQAVLTTVKTAGDAP